MKAYDLLDVAVKFGSGRCIGRIGVDWDDEVGELPAQNAGCDDLEAAEDWEKGDRMHVESSERLLVGPSADRRMHRNNYVWWRWEGVFILALKTKGPSCRSSLEER